MKGTTTDQRRRLIKDFETKQIHRQEEKKKTSRNLDLGKREKKSGGEV